MVMPQIPEDLAQRETSVAPTESGEALAERVAETTTRFNEVLAGILRARRDDPRVAAQIAEIATRIDADPVTITFGGHFSSGKSSMINAALQRSILPTDDLPETGAICLLRCGERDAAEIHFPNARRELACTTDAIRGQVSVYGDSGERRSDLREVAWLNVTLASVAIPPRARWIDSPGINDTEDMDFRAWQAARYSDVLVWVVSSRQPLAETEVAFINRHVAERGPSSIVFLINAFLREDVPDAWDAFHERQLPFYLKKIEHWALALGLSTMPRVVVASARAVVRQGGSGYGGPELRQLLASLNTPVHPRARCARLAAATNTLRGLLNQPVADSWEVRWAEAEAIVARIGLPGGRAPLYRRPGFLPGQERPRDGRPKSLPP